METNLKLNGHGKKQYYLFTQLITHQKENLHKGQVFNTGRQESSGGNKEKKRSLPRAAP